MNARALIDDFNRRGIRLIANPPNLTVKPASKLTDQDREAIRALKPELLVLLLQGLGPGTLGDTGGQDKMPENAVADALGRQFAPELAAAIKLIIAAFPGARLKGIHPRAPETGT